MKAVPFGALDPLEVRDLVRRALAEDMGSGDVTTDALVPASAMARGEFLAVGDELVSGGEGLGELRNRLVEGPGPLTF